MTCPQSKSGKSDTTPEARRVQRDLYRWMPLGRRLELAFDMCDTGRQLAIAGLRMRHPDAAEDIILLKLRWFRETGCTSERQWTDVLGVLAVQGEALDFDYFAEWARKLGLEELLSRAKAEAQT